jgi:hypothetical protein
VHIEEVRTVCCSRDRREERVWFRWGKQAKTPILRRRHRNECNIKMDCQEIGWGEGLDCSGPG